MADLPDNPNNREEEYLADIAGLPNNVPENPWSRKEAYLAAISGRLDGIDAKIAALATDISLKGSVADYDHLPTDAAVGDAYITEDTGILYVWVGDEWTPLNIQGGGGVGQELTSADYNYHISGDTHDGVAIWKMPAGCYVADGTVKVYVSSSNSAYIRSCTTYYTKNASYGYVVYDDSGAEKLIINQIWWNGGTFVTSYTMKAIPSVVQTTGTSTTDVMSQDAVTSMVYADPGVKTKVQIGLSSSVTSSGAGGVAIGTGATVQHQGSVALGYGASTSAAGQVSIRSSLSNYGYNNTVYRLLSGLYDPQSAHDAATKGYVDGRTSGYLIVPISQNDYDQLQTKDANTIYIITGA